MAKAMWVVSADGKVIALFEDESLILPSIQFSYKLEGSVKEISRTATKRVYLCPDGTEVLVELHRVQETVDHL